MSGGHGGARARSDMAGTSRTGRRWTSATPRESGGLPADLRSGLHAHARDVCRVIYDRPRKRYRYVTDRKVSAARMSGAPLTGVADMLLSLDPEQRAHVVAAVIVMDDAIAAHRDPPVCVLALLHAAQHSNADDVRATSDAFAALTDDDPATDAPALRALVAAKLADIARDRRAIAAAHARLAGMEGA